MQRVLGAIDDDSLVPTATACISRNSSGDSNSKSISETLLAPGCAS